VTKENSVCCGAFIYKC